MTQLAQLSYTIYGKLQSIPMYMLQKRKWRNCEKVKKVFGFCNIEKEDNFTGIKKRQDAVLAQKMTNGLMGEKAHKTLQAKQRHLFSFI